MNSKETVKRGTLSLIIRDIGGPGRRLMGLSIAVIAVAKLALAAAPSVSGTITDHLVDSVNTGIFETSFVVRQCMILALLYLVGYGVDGFVNKNMVQVSQTLICKLRNMAQEKLNRLPLDYMDNHPLGDTLSRVTNDMVSLSNSVESTVSNLIGQMILLTGLVVMMLVTNVRLALIYIIVLPLGFLLTGLVIKKTNRLFTKQNEAMGDLNALVSDTYSNHMLMRSFGCEDVKLDSFAEKNRVFYDTYSKSRFLSGFVIPLSVLNNNIAFIILCIVGGILLMKGQLTIGQFQAFIFYGNMVGTPLAALSSSMNNIQTGLTAAARVYELLDEADEPEEQAGSRLPENGIKGEVRFEHVKFGYLPGKELMSDVSFTAQAGQTMAIVGPSGAGKTTLINLLMRFYEIWGGKISIDGINAADLTKSDLRSVFGMVLQDTWIFDGTIAENIGYGRPDATREEIIRAAKLVQCDTFIEKLPDSYDTVISEENSALSTGEKQLLSIARAVISDPKILILDEATSQVDTRTESLITRAMERMMEGRTSFIIAHRLYTIKNADKIIFMVDGDIREVGSHDELMEKHGLYAGMYSGGASFL